MKALKSILAVSLLLVSLSGYADDKIVSKDQLPQKALQFVDKHFAGLEIVQVTKDKDLMSSSYDVILQNGTKLEFDSKGVCTDMESKGQTKLPDSAIPKNILTYVQKNYPDATIRKWELDDKKQDVKLSNGFELVFDKNGKFLRIDD